MDESDLCEFWKDYHTGNGWLYEVEEGGWRELESMRSEFLAPHIRPLLREFLIVCDKCISVFAVGPPDIEHLGGDPAQEG